MAVLAVQIVKYAVTVISQLVVMEIGVFFLANGLTTPPAQGYAGPDPSCTASSDYYKLVSELQTFQVGTVFLAVLLVTGLKLYVDLLGEAETAVVAKWKQYIVRSAFIVAVLASGVATVLAAIILYTVMLVKVGIDKQGCLPGPLKPVLICVFVLVGFIVLVVHGFLFSVIFRVPAAAAPPPHDQ